MHPLVSIIIPVYNGELTISDCLLSVINQLYRNIEIIVIDDGSIDKTAEIVQSFIQKESRIKYEYQPNSGSPIAKNRGINMAKGKYIQFLDADDIISKDKIKNQILILIANPNSIAVCRTQIFYSTNDLEKDNLEEIDSDFLKITEYPFDFLMNLLGVNGKIGMVQPNAFLTPVALINAAGSWSEELSRSPDDDSEMFCRILIKADKILYDPNSINYYRKSLNYLSQGKSLQNAQGAFMTIKKKFKLIFSIRNNYQIRKLYTIHLTNCAYNYGLAFPIIIEWVKTEIDIHGIGKFCFIDNSNYFSFIANLIGFSRAMKIRKIKNQLFHNNL